MNGLKQDGTRFCINNRKQSNKYKGFQLAQTAQRFDRKLITRQSISLTEPNDEQLKKQVNNYEYSSKSVLVNYSRQQVQIDNNIQRLIEIFSEVLLEIEFKNVFKIIVFAIEESKNNKSDFSPIGNLYEYYTTFNQGLLKNYIYHFQREIHR